MYRVSTAPFLWTVFPPDLASVTPPAHCLGFPHSRVNVSPLRDAPCVPYDRPTRHRAREHYPAPRAPLAPAASRRPLRSCEWRSGPPCRRRSRNPAGEQPGWPHDAPGRSHRVAVTAWKTCVVRVLPLFQSTPGASDRIGVGALGSSTKIAEGVDSVCGAAGYRESMRRWPMTD